MAYTRQTWTSGDVITAEKLNKIEDGIANGGGLQLYGPYNASLGNSITVLANQHYGAELSVITSNEGTHILPSNDEEIKFIMSSFYCGDNVVKIKGFEMPYVSGDSPASYHVTLYNGSNEAVTVSDCHVNFYTTSKLELEQEPILVD